MLKLLRRRPGLRRLFAGTVISMAGDWLTYVAVSVLVLETRGGPLAIATVLVAHTLPKAAAAPLAGWLADRVDHGRMLVVASAARGLLVLGMAGAAAAGEIELMQAMLFARMAGGAFVDAPSQAVLPRLVPRRELGAANTLLGAAWSVVFAAGVAAGGLVAAALGPVAALVGDGLTFFAAAGLFAGLGRLVPRMSPGAAAAPDSASLESLREPWTRPVLAAALAKVPVAVSTGGAWVLLHEVAERGSALGPALALGTLHLARAVGSGLGPAGTRALFGRRPAAGATAGALLALAGVAVLAGSGGLAGPLVGAVLWGAGTGINWVDATTRLQGAAAPGALGRLSAVDMLGQTVGQCAGGLAVALLAIGPGDETAMWAPLGLGLAAWLGLAARGRRRPWRPWLALTAAARGRAAAGAP